MAEGESLSSLPLVSCLYSSLAKLTQKPEEKRIYCYSLYRQASLGKTEVENGFKETNKNIQHITQSWLHLEEQSHLFIYWFIHFYLFL